MRNRKLRFLIICDFILSATHLQMAIKELRQDRIRTQQDYFKLGWDCCKDKFETEEGEE